MSRPRAHDARLREQLLVRATDAIARTGVENLSLRSLATSADTSTSAIYQLFGSREALLDAVYLRVVEKLNRAQAGAPVREDPVENVLELARAYRRWALENRNQFLVLVGRITPSDALIAQAAGQVIPVEDRVRDAIDQGVLSGPLDQVVLSLWSAVHGYTALEVAGVITGSDDDFEAVARAAYRAWLPAGSEG